jgi:hypothetical protein
MLSTKVNIASYIGLLVAAITCASCESSRDSKVAANVFNLPDGTRQISVVGGKEFVGKVGPEGVRMFDYHSITVKVPKGVDTVVNPQVFAFGADQQGIGFIYIDEAAHRMRVRLMRVTKDKDGKPVGLEPHSVNGEYEMRLSPGSPESK